MKKILLFCLFTSLSVNTAFSQTDKSWKKVERKNNLTVNKSVNLDNFPSDFNLYELNLSSIQQLLFTIVDTGTDKNVIITIPNANGKLERFKVQESSNFDPALQVRFPNIRAFVGQSLDDNHAQIHLSYSPEGIQTMVFRASTGTEYLEPFSEDKKTYAVHSRDANHKRKFFTCTTPDEKLEYDLLDKGSNINRSSDLSLKTFRLAMSVTGEYSAYHGGTTASVLAAVNTTMTRVNGVYQKDLAIKMNLVNNTTILYLNAGTDPYGPTDAAYSSELQTTLTSVVGDANYDVGHLMSAIGNNGSAGCIGCVCVNGSKGSGFTTSTFPVGDTFDIDFVVHEFGHQFGANHSFSFQENNSVNYEPGSGVTIMGYAGITDFDVAPNSIDTFHAGNIAQIQANMAGKTCDIETPITHGAPVVSAGSNFTIPRSTPFILTGSATDSGGTSTMTYQWEQYNDGAVAQQGPDSGASPTKTLGPNFRSYFPTSSGTRYFPIMASSLAGNKTTAGSEILVEALSSVARTLNFRLTARDNVLNGGQTNFGNMVVTVANIAPLDITSQNTDGISYTPGSTQTVTWTSTGNSGIAGGSNVDILFSTDNGLTWGTTLLTATPNDGTQVVTLPAGVIAPFCRFLVKASANIFFNVTTKAFAVGYTVTNACNTYTDSASFPIPSQPGFITRTLNVPTTVNITSVKVVNAFQHDYPSDLQTDISSPANPGTFVKLFNRSCGATASEFNLQFADGAAAINCALGTTSQTIAPTAALSTFNGQNPNGNWTLRVYDNFAGDDGIFRNWAVEICSQTIALSNQDFEFEDFSLYPNPNNGDFTIKFKSNSTNDIKINVYDMRGRSILDKSYTNTTNFNQNIALDQVQAGIYLVSIVDGAKKIVKRIVIQ